MQHAHAIDAPEFRRSRRRNALLTARTIRFTGFRRM
jgi:hypothetical protein